MERKLVVTKIKDSTKEHANIAHTMRLVWTVIGIGIIIVAVGVVLQSVMEALIATLAAALLVFILRKPVDWCEQRGIPRVASSAVLVIFVVCALGAIIVAFIPVTVEQITALVKRAPDYINEFNNWWSNLGAQYPDIFGNAQVKGFVSQVTSGLQNMLVPSGDSNIIGNVYDMGMSIANIVIMAFTAFIVAFWVLIDYRTITHEVHVLASWTAQWYITLFGTILSRVFGGYIKGTLIGAFIIAVLSGLLYWIIGVPFPMVMGILSGLLSIVPYVGPIFSTIIIAIISIFSGFLTIVGSILISMLVPWIIGTFVSPRVMSSTVNLHPGITLVAIIIGGALGGALGMILAIPVTAFIKCVFVYFYESIAGRQLVSENGALFDGHPNPERIDPVADATDNYLTMQTLREKVQATEDEVAKLPPAPPRKFSNIWEELSHPMDAAMKFERSEKEMKAAYDAESIGSDGCNNDGCMEQNEDTQPQGDPMQAEQGRGEE